MIKMSKNNQKSNPTKSSYYIVLNTEGIETQGIIRCPRCHSHYFVENRFTQSVCKCGEIATLSDKFNFDLSKSVGAI